MATIFTYVGSGRAKCGNCNKVIKKGDRGIEANHYRDSRKFCKRCVLSTLLGRRVSDNLLALMELEA